MAFYRWSQSFIQIKDYICGEDAQCWIWILGILLTFVSFFIMETRFLKGAEITIKEFQTNMKNHILNRIKGNR